MIELKGISKIYDRKVLDDFSYRFEQGKIYVIKGVSGTGKTTLLNILGGLDFDFVGEYVFYSDSVKGLQKNEKESFRAKIGYIFQNSLLLSKLSIMENLLFIRNDEVTIKYYADKFHVSSLLSKYPEQLSGGERQRISIIRALLGSPKVILADEPTASLDHKNSEKIAEAIKEISSAENIVIIATHEKCFDDVADEIIHLEYGKAGSVIKKGRATSESGGRPLAKRGKEKDRNTTSILKYVYRRNKDKYKLLRLLPAAVIMTFLLFCISAQNNIQKEYSRKIYEKYPFNVFVLSNGTYELLKDSYSFTLYENYTIDEEGVSCYPLFEKENSGLSFGQVIEHGRFPEKENEVIVSREYVKNRMNTQEYERCVGEDINIGGHIFIVSAIMSDLSQGEDLSLVYYNNYYKIKGPSAVFIPYDTIKKIGYKVESPVKMVRLDDLYDDPDIIESLRSANRHALSVWDAKVYDLQYTTDALFGIIMAAVLIVSFISYIFIKNEIQLELYYRRKEIGYLQVFSVSKKQVRRIIVFERVFRTAMTLIYAFVLFTLCVIAVKILLDINGTIPLWKLLLFSFAIIMYSAIKTLIPCNKFLKKDIVSLIKD